MTEKPSSLNEAEIPKISSILIIKESPIARVGSFATRNIEVGETIIKFSGQLLTGVEVDRMILAGKSGPDDELQIDDDLFLILRDDSGLINHSCNPNSGIRGGSELFAIRNIQKKEEVTFDYSTTIGINVEPDWLTDNRNWSMDCNCGSENCRKRVGNVSTIPEEVLRKYLLLGALPDFIKRQITRYKLLEE